MTALTWSKNPDLDKLMTFEDDPYGVFEPDESDMRFQLVWYLDPVVNPLTDKVWAISCRPVGKIDGVKDMGYLLPNINIEYNEDLPDLGIDFNQCCPAFWELADECVWELDPVHTPDKRMWVVKYSPAYRKPASWKWYGTITPQYDIKHNPDLPKMHYEIDYAIPWHDLAYEHIWMLDNKHLHNGEDEIWAIKVKVTNDTTDIKFIDYISPVQNIERNPDIPKIDYKVNYVIPWHDLGYEHVWYADDENRTWIIKLSTTKDTIGIKEMEVVTPSPEVVFISYHETNAEDNWRRVLEKAPNAKRVDGVKGIFNAHKAAAKLVKTDMFYVVDGDAYLTDEFQFDYQPSIHDRDCTHIWRAKNPINGSVYGYGGVKLFSTKIMRSAKAWTTLDLSTTVVDKVRVVDIVSNITAFDTDAKSVWRSAFRECVKLQYNLLQNSRDRDSQTRLHHWCYDGVDHQFGKYSMDAAAYAVEWATNNRNDFEALKMINDREWIEEQFNNRKFI